ncbi:MAG: hypothetical protein ACP5MB_09180 [bacterium]
MPCPYQAANPKMQYPKNAIGKFAHSFGVPMQNMGRTIHLRYKDFLL